MIDKKSPLVALREYVLYNQLQAYKPYGHPDTLCPDGALWKLKRDNGEWETWSNRPWQFNFHRAGATHQERMLAAANRVGKSRTIAAESAMHFTGIYPDWWEGRRFDKPGLWWVASRTAEAQKDVIQKALIGGMTKEQIGTGMIPRDKFMTMPTRRQCGIADVADTVKIRHVSGGVTDVSFKSYDQGWEKFEGAACLGVVLDEEPRDFKIYTSCLSRVLTTNGILMVGMIPLFGQTEFVDHFQNPSTSGIYFDGASWDDAPHLLKAERERIKMSYPEHERATRSTGAVMMGEGRIFTYPEEKIRCQPFPIPDHYARICGIDFGTDHPFGEAWLAYDRDKDIVFVYDVHKESDRDTIYHAARLKRKGNWVPVAWPHDGEIRDRANTAGSKFAEQYRLEGVNMLAQSARYKTDKGGSQPQWPMIEEVRNRMLTGRFKVFSTCHDFFAEYRNYHMDNGKIVPKRDDVLKASFYALMMLRYAVSKTAAIVYDDIPQAVVRL